MIQAFKSTGTAPSERLVGYMLADHLNDSTGRCDPSIALLAEETGLAPRSVNRSIRRLEEMGHITIVPKLGARNSYRLHPKSAPQQAPTPDTVSDLTQGQIGLDVTPTPVTVSSPPLTQGPKPLTQGHPNHKNRKSNRNLNHKAPELGLGPAEEKTSKAKAGSREEVQAFAATEGIPAIEAAIFWDKMEACGWMRGNHKVKDWKAHFRMHYRLGYLTPKDNGSRYARPEEKIDINAREPGFEF